MAFTYDAGSNNGARNDSPGNPVAWNHTVAATANFLVVATRNYDSNPVIAVTGVTAGGNAMTQLATHSPTGPNDDNLTYWYISNPPTGTVSISVTFASAGTGQFNGVATSWIVDSLPISVRNSGAAGFASRSSSAVTLTGLTSGDLMVGVCGGYTSGMAASGDCVERTDTGQCAMYSLAVDAASETMTVTHITDTMNLVVAAFAESSGGGFTPNPLMHQRMMAGGAM